MQLLKETRSIGKVSYEVSAFLTISEEGTLTEKDPFFLIPFRVYRSLRRATEIAGGLFAAIPHQATVIKFGLSFTLAPTKTAGMG